MSLLKYYALRTIFVSVLALLLLSELRVLKQLTSDRATNKFFNVTDSNGPHVDTRSFPTVTNTSLASSIDIQQQFLGSDPGVAVCLSFSDDNMILPEWLAYHYTRLPLRHLVLLKDPASKTSPESILRRWNESNLVTSWIWNDKDFMRRELQKRMNKLVETESVEDHHRRLKTRQKVFQAKCNQHFKGLQESHNITWVGHFDVDEFIVPNRIAPWEKRWLRRKGGNETAYRLKGFPPVSRAFEIRHEVLGDPSSQNLTVLDVLNRVRHHYYTPNCMPMSRWNHGSMEDEQDGDTNQKNRLLGGIFNASHLETLRYTFTDDPFRPRKKIMGKMIVDISQIPLSNLSKSISPHRPVPTPHCTKSNIPHVESALVVNHYKGSWERFSFRADSRRTREQWEADRKLFARKNSKHLHIEDWLPQFVDLVGSEDRAAFLLELQ